MKVSLFFIEKLEQASLESKVEPLSVLFLDRLRNPPTSPLKIDDPGIRLSIELFLSNSRASDDKYTEACQAVSRAFPEAELLSLHEVIEELSGITPIWRDMCPNSCMAYTGPFFHLEHCSWCGENRYRLVGQKQTARQHFPTIPIGGILQAMNRTVDGADAMNYRVRYTEKVLRDL
ncbi:hypothetical protein L218DRAFT_880570 [Marasmius fiardii PR-910]|nr:hypothetical protein L218DRAFT_880570 [Marasmius fiardii PR-910]